MCLQTLYLLIIKKVHIPAFVRKVGTGHGSHGRLPCATGLASYPSSCVWCVCKRATAVFAAPPVFRILLSKRRCRRGFGGFRPSGSIRGRIDLISRFRLRGREPFDGLIPSSGTVGIVPPHWLAVTTAGVLHRLRSPVPSETRMGGASLGLRLVSLGPRHFIGRVAVRARSPPHPPVSQCGRVRPPPGERVTYALELSLLPKMEASKGPGTPVPPDRFARHFLRHPALSRGRFPDPPRRIFPSTLFCQRTAYRKAEIPPPVNRKVL